MQGLNAGLHTPQDDGAGCELQLLINGMSRKQSRAVEALPEQAHKSNRGYGALGASNWHI